MARGPEFFTRNTTEDVVIRTTLDQRRPARPVNLNNLVQSSEIKRQRAIEPGPNIWFDAADNTRSAAIRDNGNLLPRRPIQNGDNIVL